MEIYFPVTGAIIGPVTVDWYIDWLKKQGDTIRILPIARGAEIGRRFTPLIEVYRNKTKDHYHCVEVTQAEAAEINRHMPPVRKDGYINIKKMK